MDPLSMRVANPLLPAHAEAPANALAQALPAAAGQVVTGCGSLANRQIAVGTGEGRTRANEAVPVIGAILAKASNALQAIVLGPRS
ncbi:hypothetical protein [Pantoea sp. 18069]|uniref:hypothetical protein n=1 Tax=Pantoea sp. 18069 TaxID=2681415 RepID=UPI00135BDD12|nr:hypothetical protein [Pantoea sp. 18069]